MYKRKTGIIGIVITVVILILLVFLTNLKLESLSYIENAVSTIVMPIQTGYTYLKNKVTGNSSFFTNMDNLKTENEELKNRNSELEQQLRELEIMRAENDTLKEYLGLTKKYTDYKAVPAYIISKDVSNYSSIFVINAGKKDGIDVNMTVISDAGLVRICNICNRKHCKGSNNNRLSKLCYCKC
ncbi:MAG: rod shape-determining protein MreC [Clostridia bacterium]|nr:rod shape-determining protein MreC [Clostridia bacterium]